MGQKDNKSGRHDNAHNYCRDPSITNQRKVQQLVQDKLMTQKTIATNGHNTVYATK